jgi:hypothetical protein
MRRRKHFPAATLRLSLRLLRALKQPLAEFAGIFGGQASQIASYRQRHCRESTRTIASCAIIVVGGDGFIHTSDNPGLEH